MLIACCDNGESRLLRRNTMNNQGVVELPRRASAQPDRLHFLDGLRVVAIVMVFVVHVLHVFDGVGWHIKNAETSAALMPLVGFLAAWGMPFFFLIAGAGSWLALRRRTPRRFAGERLQRLLIPYVVGVLLLMPIMLFFEWRQRLQTGATTLLFPEYVISRPVDLSPRLFAWTGYHLWFLGFLFCFSMLALPLFVWLKGEHGSRLLSSLAHLCERRAGIVLLVLPLLVVELSLRPFFADEYGWADFCYFFCFYVAGFVLFADERFRVAIRRDWALILSLSVAAFTLLLAVYASGSFAAWGSDSGLPQFYLFWTIYVLDGWSWTLVMLFIGMRFLDITNRWLQYGQEASLPFYVLHQPVIIAVAFVVVQWDAGIALKMLLIALGSFACTIAIYEAIVKRLSPLRAMFGIKSPPMQRQQGDPSLAQNARSG
jgi:glucans biosynthesis protein C